MGVPISQAAIPLRDGELPLNCLDRQEPVMSQISTELQPRALVASSRSLDLSLGIVVCIPSFRRPQHLRLTLESLGSQRTDRRFAVIVVENDALRSESAPVAAEFLHAGKIQGLCAGRAAPG